MSAYEVLRSRFEGTEVVVSRRENDGAQVDARNVNVQSGLNVKNEIERLLPSHIVGGNFPMFVISLRPKTESIASDVRK